MNRYLGLSVWCMIILRLEKSCLVRRFWSGGSIIEVLQMMRKARYFVIIHRWERGGLVSRRIASELKLILILFILNDAGMLWELFK
jgi:hypothetical protein